MYRHFECSGCSGCWKFVFSWLPRVEQKCFWRGATYNGHVCPLACVNMSTRFSVSFVFHTTQTPRNNPWSFFPEVLTVEFLPHVALLPNTIYAFRLRVISPTLDQVRGRFWSLQTLNFNDAAGIWWNVVIWWWWFVCFHGPVKGFFLNVVRF